MRSKKLLILYAFLLIVAVVTMVQLWRLNQRPQEIGPRDYPEIKEEGILRMITEYNQSGYFVSGDTVQLMIMVAKGDIDYAVCDQQIARMTQKKLPEVDILTDVSFTQLQSWAVRKDSPVLLDSLNSWLQQIKDSGLYDQIYKRYYK